MQISDHVLSVGAHTQELPRLAKEAIVTVWQVPAEYQPSGYFVAVDPAGAPATLPACDGASVVLVGSLPLSAAAEEQLAQAKAERLAAINVACDASLAAITSMYPRGEISSWPQQVQEAQALSVDPSADAPLLAALASERGLAVSDLAGRVLAKAAAFSVVSGQLIGRRQAREDALEAAATTEEVSVVEW